MPEPLNYHQERSLLDPQRLQRWHGLPLCWLAASPVAYTRHLMAPAPVLALIDSGAGEADFDFGGRQVHLDVSEGTMGLFEPGAARTSRWRCDGVRRIMLQVDLPWLVGRGLADDEWASLRLRPQVAFRDPTVAGLLRAMAREVADGCRGGAGYAESLSVDLLTRIAHTHGIGWRRTRERCRLTPAQLRRIEALIDARLDGAVPLSDLAASVGLSAPHFTRLFRYALGCSPHQHVLRRRVERATTLLRQTTLPLANIASAAGFATQSHMNAVFVRQLGATPGQYRAALGRSSGSAAGA